MASSRRTGTNESRWTGSAWEAGVNTFGAAGFGRDYTSLTTWEADTDVDIVTATVSPVLECYDDLDIYPLTGGPTFSGTTSSTTYFRILRAASSARHKGVSGGGVVFNMVGTGTLGFNIGEVGFKLQDVECRHATNNAGDASAITGTQQAGIEVVGCIAKCTNAGAGAGNGIIFANSQNYRVVNCVAFECKTNGISIRGSTARILNCTSVSNGGVGFTFVTDAPVVIGCIAQDNTGGDFAASFASGSNYNLSKDTSAPGANSVISTDLAFRDPSSDVYLLASVDTGAIGAGSDLSAYSDFAFDDDIAFTARGGTWDIGAHEYVTVATVTAAEDVIAFNIGTGAAGTTVTVNHHLGTTPAFGILIWSGRAESTSTAGGATFNRGWGWFKSMGGSPTDFYAVGSRDQDAAGTAICDGGQRVDACIFEMGDGAAVGWADVQSVTATQITFEILDAFATDLRVICKLWGGTDYTKCAMGVMTPTGAAPVTQEVATSDGGAFQPDIVFFMSAMIANDASAIAVDSTIMFGAMRTASEEYVFLGGGNNAQNNMQTKSYSNPNECIAQFGTDPTASPVNRAEFSAIGSGSFTINWLERGNANRVFWMAVKGGSWKVGNTVTQTDTTTQFSVTTSFQPNGGLVIGHCKAESTQDDPPSANDEWSMGAFTSASKRYAHYVGSRDGIGTSQVMTAYRTDAVYVNMDVTADAIEGLMDVHSMNSNGVTFIMDDADPAVLSFVGVILSGPAASSAQNISATAASASFTFTTPAVVPGAVTATATAALGTFSAISATVPRRADATAGLATFSAVTPVVNVKVPATSAAATFAAITPTVVPGAVTSTATAALATFSAMTPTVVPVVTVPATAALATFAANNAALSTSVSATAALATFSAITPTLALNIPATSAVSTFVVVTPAVVSPVTVAATASLATFSASTAGITVIVPATAALATFTPVSPSIVAGAVTVAATSALATFSGITPTVQAVVTLAATAALATFTANDATVSTTANNLNATAALATFSVITPSVTAVVSVPVTSAIATFTAITPSVTSTVLVAATSGSATFTSSPAITVVQVLASAASGSLIVGTAAVATSVIVSASSARADFAPGSALVVQAGFISATAAVGTWTSVTPSLLTPVTVIGTAALATFMPSTPGLLTPVTIGSTSALATFMSASAVIVPGGTQASTTPAVATFMPVTPFLLTGFISATAAVATFVVPNAGAQAEYQASTRIVEEPDERRVTVMRFENRIIEVPPDLL